MKSKYVLQEACNDRTTPLINITQTFKNVESSRIYQKLITKMKHKLI
jgi:hypothetical protein